MYEVKVHELIVIKATDYRVIMMKTSYQKNLRRFEELFMSLQTNEALSHGLSRQTKKCSKLTKMKQISLDEKCFCCKCKSHFKAKRIIISNELQAHSKIMFQFHFPIRPE